MEITEYNVPQMYEECFHVMRACAQEEISRNGPVMAMPTPTQLTILNPKERVLFDPLRNANPFFHVMETVWMFSGTRDIKWIEQFNKGFRKYADLGTDYHHGAYGHRWLNHFGLHQIQRVVNLLKVDQNSRRAVLAMWDPAKDLEYHNDIPCNTHIYFRNTRDGLDMTVCNRSNDLVWGCLGSNVVCFTYLHELICHAVGLPQGTYRVFTNNLHVYKSLKNFEVMWETPNLYDPYRMVEPLSLLKEGESYIQFMHDCTMMVMNPTYRAFKTNWMHEVALPIYLAYMDRLGLMSDGMTWVNLIGATDWRLACQEWISRKTSSFATSMEQLQMKNTGPRSTSKEGSQPTETGTDTTRIVQMTNQ